MSVINRNAAAPIFDTLANAVAANMRVGQMCIVKNNTGTDGVAMNYEVKTNGSGGIAMNNGNELFGFDFNSINSIADLPPATGSGNKISVTAFYGGWAATASGIPYGGGELVDAMVKRDHDGVLSFDPSRSEEIGTPTYNTPGAPEFCWVRVPESNVYDASWAGLKPDNSSDTYYQLQKLLNIVHLSGGGRVCMPPGAFALSEGLILLEGVYLEGAGAETWEISTPKGTMLRTVPGVTLPVLTCGDGAETRSLGVEMIKLRGNGSNVGLRLKDSVHNSRFDRVVAQTCTLAFEINLCWNIEGHKLIAQQSDVGFKFQGTTGGTSSTYTSCLAYNCTTGFFLEQALSYSSFIACGTDSCGTSLYSNKGSRGVSFVNYGVEFGTVAGVVIENEAQIDFIGLHFGDHSATAINLFDVSNLNGSVTIVGCNAGGAFSPIAPGRYFNIDAASRTLVTFIGCSIFGERGDIDKCVKIGGGQGNYIGGVDFFSPQTFQVAVGTEATTRTIESKLVVLEPLTADRFLNGTPVFDVSNVEDGTIITFINKDPAYNIGLRTETSTPGSGIFRHPTNVDDTLRMNDIGTSVQCIKLGSSLYEVLVQL